ncbi:hypothetical protein AB1L30_19910 [Bremerella sp. JC817]|uniref:hypothetical protein n=1 Tax=Bremerella sp. JC817 TaxID=3231756 RepID=UPI00345AB3EA
MNDSADENRSSPFDSSSEGSPRQRTHRWLWFWAGFGVSYVGLLCFFQVDIQTETGIRSVPLWQNYTHLLSRPGVSSDLLGEFGIPLGMATIVGGLLSWVTRDLA